MSDLTDQLLSGVSCARLSSRSTVSGQVRTFDGRLLECDGFPVSVGSVCAVETADGDRVRGEVISFNESRNRILLYDLGGAIHAGARVTLEDEGVEVDTGSAYLGRVIDALGAPLDGADPPQGEAFQPLAGHPLNPLARESISEVFDVGVRAVNGLLTIGRGQRVGIIAGSGVGKSVLLSMMARHAHADVIVVGLIGERAREVGDMVRGLFDDETRKRLCVVAVPADRSPLLRLRAANRATALAEHFRDKGLNVLLILDSLTRVAHAQREIGLSLGEAPTAKGYPTSALAVIPRLIERAGRGEGPYSGSITGIYTVLADGDDTNDPVVDTSRAILDGHIVLSRVNAQQGIYPAIDVPASISRVMGDITTSEHANRARRFRALVSTYLENRDLMLMGGYVRGQDPDLDQAVELWPKLTDYIRQYPDTPVSFDAARHGLKTILG